MITDAGRKLIFDAAKRRGAEFRTRADVRDMDAAIDAAFGVVIPDRQLRCNDLANPAAFYAAVRKITKRLDQTQVDTIGGLLKAAAHWPTGWLAYGFATAFHEARLRPIHELGGRAYLSKYDTGKLAKALGNTPEADGDGIKYAGRGLVQLTGLRNYQRAADELGIPLVSNPDLALEPGTAVRILVWGMEGGKFTGKKLADYLPGDQGLPDQFIAARRVINGMDRAHLIAGHAIKFQDALEAGGWA